MPPASSAIRESCGRRLQIYFGRLMADKCASKTAIGSLVRTNATRVKAWAAGQWYMAPHIAFELGEELRLRRGWETSGVEFLWACGHLAEILEILAYLSADDFLDDGDVDSRTSGPEQAALLYCWLPGRMWDFEIENIIERLRNKHGIAEPNLDTRLFKIALDRGIQNTAFDYADNADGALAARVDVLIRDADPASSEIWRYFGDRSREERDGGVPSGVAWDRLARRVLTESLHERIARAWERYNRGDLVTSSNDLALPIGATKAMRRVQRAVINALIEATRALDGEIFSSYAVPKIWRMLAGWIDDVAPENQLERAALRDTFIAASEIQSRDWQEFIMIEEDLASREVAR